MIALKVSFSKYFKKNYADLFSRTNKLFYLFFNKLNNNKKMESKLEFEFIPYEQALDLKELGFDKPCLFSYNIYNTKTLNSAYYNYVNHNNIPNMVSAPLYQQAFRWFRDKYGLNCNINPNYIESDGIERSLYNWSCRLKGISNSITYEQAELECLKQLIDIAKEQK